MMQLHTNDFTFYRQHIIDRGHTASGFLCAGLRNSSSNLLCTQTNSYRSRGERESVPNYSDEFLYKPTEQNVFDPAQTTAAPLFSPPRQQTFIADFFIQKITSLNSSFTTGSLLLTSLLLISCWCGKPRPHPLCPPRGGRSLPRAGSPLTDSFLIWWGGGPHG